uniref:Uncharacterized protein LOC104242458 n=1 Tax=Nicotiana sylvestris TaxID=4096 RepID=A0A1U7XY14_NICSY|nr:PREDICTED: uncharacterized protein LOC104242458 [Nicotiana sylvestris]
MARHGLLNFLEAYSGYNQILMEEEDQEKTTFITHQETYCYKVMPFELNNVGATYQKLLNQIPRAQNIEADGLAKLATTTKSITGEGNVVTFLHSSIDQIEDGVLSDDKKEAKKLRMQAARYNVINNDLYKTYGSPLAKCLGLNKMRCVLDEVHKGHCGAYTSN